MPHLFISQIGVGAMALMIPMLGLLIPIIVILVKHQQRMAEIVHGNSVPQPNPEIEALRREVYELKQLIHQQMIALDSHEAKPTTTVDVPLQRRLEEA